MILKKPYALLIKYFKVIHLFLLIFTIYIIYKANSLLSFFNTYLSVQESVVGKNLNDSLFTSLMYIFPIIAIIVSVVLLWLMGSKKKPFRFYLYNFLVNIFALVTFIIAHSFLNIMQVKMIDIVNIRLIRDFLIILLFLQSLSIIVIFVRVIGFDIKNFNFSSDLQELEISEEDQEEYEVDFNIDSNESRRKRNRNIRYLKYSYKENRFLINSVLIIIFVICSVFIYSKNGIYTRLNKEGILLSTEYYDFKVDNTYLVNTSYSGNKITDNYLVVLNLKIRNKELQNRIMTSNFKLLVNNNKYSVTNKYDKYLVDIGSVYSNQFLSNEYHNYLLVYEIPITDIDRNMKLIYYENSKDVKVKLKPIKEKISYKEYCLGNTIDIDKFNSISINSYDIEDSFIIDYDFCIKDKCYKSNQYVVPTLNTNYDKAIIKINGTSIHKQGSTYNNFDNLILGLGTIQYTKDGVTNISSLTKISNLKKVDNDVYYYEINKNVINADNIKLVFGTRKCKYSYILK